jgi:hypothetical protein
VSVCVVVWVGGYTILCRCGQDLDEFKNMLLDKPTLDLLPGDRYEFLGLQTAFRVVHVA